MPKLRLQLINGLALILLVAGCETVSRDGSSISYLVNGEPSTYTVLRNDPRITQLRRVGLNVVKEALRRDLHEVLPPADRWEFAVIDDDSPNAFVFPDGKVGFNVGLFTYVQTDDDVAVILGHELADILTHLTKEHITTEPSEQSPSTESAADHLGLIIMAHAGYNPEAAPLFWRHLSTARSRIKRKPDSFRSHPLDEKRINQLEGWMAEAKAQAAPSLKP